MSVVAMMVCETKSPDPAEGEVGSVGLRCVADASGEYAEFFKYTPWGECKIGTINQTAFAQFELGATYRVTFEKV